MDLINYTTGAGFTARDATTSINVPSWSYYHGSPGPRVPKRRIRGHIHRLQISHWQSTTQHAQRQLQSPDHNPHHSTENPWSGSRGPALRPLPFSNGHRESTTNSPSARCYSDATGYKPLVTYALGKLLMWSIGNVSIVANSTQPRYIMHRIVSTRNFWDRDPPPQPLGLCPAFAGNLGSKQGIQFKTHEKARNTCDRRANLEKRPGWYIYAKKMYQERLYEANCCLVFSGWMQRKI